VTKLISLSSIRGKNSWNGFRLRADMSHAYASAYFGGVGGRRG